MIKKGIVTASLWLMIFSMAAQAMQVSFYVGDVKIIRDGKTIKVGNGTQIKSGDVIKTGKDGMLEITYNDNSKVIIREKSTVKIGSSSIKGSENPSLILGSLSCKFQKLKKGQNKIYTPTTVCAIRGTEFNVAVSQSGDSRVEVKEGQVDVSNPIGSSQVKGGEKAEAEVASAPEKGSTEELAQWLDNKDRELEKNPDKQAEKYQTYIENFKKGNDSANKDISEAKKLVTGAASKEELEKASIAIEGTEQNLEDSIMLNESASECIGIIINNFKIRKIKIYREFEKTKKESNKVLEVQKQSYADIQAVKDDYKNTYKEIMGTYKNETDKIKTDVDIDGALPEIKKYDVK